MKSLLTVAVLAALTGCASIVGSKTQSVSIQTSADSQDLTGANCTLSNDEGRWQVTSPGSVVVHKSTADLSIACVVANGFGGNAVAVSKANLGVWGNILFGGIPGYVIDRYTGAGFNYPTTIRVPLAPGAQGAASVLYPAPANAAATSSQYKAQPAGSKPLPYGYVPRSTMAM